MNEPASAWPLIYVRGYAMTRAEIDETTADPFCGFNIGSTVIRATPDPKTPPRKLIFESPLVRLQSDFGYSDVYEDSVDIGDPDFTADRRQNTFCTHVQAASFSVRFAAQNT